MTPDTAGHSACPCEISFEWSCLDSPECLVTAQLLQKGYCFFTACIWIHHLCRCIVCILGCRACPRRPASCVIETVLKHGHTGPQSASFRTYGSLVPCFVPLMSQLKVDRCSGRIFWISKISSIHDTRWNCSLGCLKESFLGRAVEMKVVGEGISWWAGWPSFCSFTALVKGQNLTWQDSNVMALTIVRSYYLHLYVQISLLEIPHLLLNKTSKDDS